MGISGVRLTPAVVEAPPPPIALLVGGAGFRRLAAEELSGAWTVRHAATPDLARTILRRLAPRLVIAHAVTGDALGVLSEIEHARPEVGRVLVTDTLAEVFAELDPACAVQIAVPEPWCPGALRAAVAAVVEAMAPRR